MGWQGWVCLKGSEVQQGDLPSHVLLGGCRGPHPLSPYGSESVAACAPTPYTSIPRLSLLRDSQNRLGGLGGLGGLGALCRNGGTHKGHTMH